MHLWLVLVITVHFNVLLVVVVAVWFWKLRMEVGLLASMLRFYQARLQQWGTLCYSSTHSTCYTNTTRLYRYSSACAVTTSCVGAQG